MGSCYEEVASSSIAVVRTDAAQLEVDPSFHALGPHGGGLHVVQGSRIRAILRAFLARLDRLTCCVVPEVGEAREWQLHLTKRANRCLKRLLVAKGVRPTARSV